MDMSNIFIIKYGALACLVLQNTFLIVFTGYSRTVEGPMYASTTAVTVTEGIKLFTCLIITAVQTGGLTGLTHALKKEITSTEMIKMSVPSVLYTLQNNLQYYALSRLDPATFQVGYQMKILTTAVFSVLMLGKKLSRLQWISLMILTIGVSLANLANKKKSNNVSNSNILDAEALMGVLAVILGTILSGFSGVYFERILKGSETTLWMRNIQMSVPSIFIGMVTTRFSSDWVIVQEKGFFYGYTGLVVFVVSLNALGGLLVAIVVKYADNILKGFAASFSIVTSCIITILFFDFIPTSQFVVGAALVTYSMHLYNSNQAIENKASELDPSSSNPLLDTSASSNDLKG